MSLSSRRCASHRPRSTSLSLSSRPAASAPGAAAPAPPPCMGAASEADPATPSGCASGLDGISTYDTAQVSAFRKAATPAPAST
eukprot:9901405-Alexandrium_andersonii.AAC.1